MGLICDVYIGWHDIVLDLYHLNCYFVQDINEHDVK